MAIYYDYGTKKQNNVEKMVFRLLHKYSLIFLCGLSDYRKHQPVSVLSIILTSVNLLTGLHVIIFALSSSGREGHIPLNWLPHARYAQANGPLLME